MKPLEPEQTKIVALEDVGQRLDRYLATFLNDLSRTTIQQLIGEGKALVNGRMSKPGYQLRLHDTVQILSMVSSARPTTIQPQSLPLDIIYEDDDLIVVNKAAGMVVHPAPGHYDDTLVNALLARYPELQGVGEDEDEETGDTHKPTVNMRPGIVHRLDRDTSGLIIVARNGRAHAALTEQLRRHEIIKRYLALVEGTVSLDQGSIDAPIGRNPHNRQQMTVTIRDSREARTYFRVIQRFRRHTLLLLQLETGRTHQIRVHLKAIGHPVVGDSIYGSGNTLRGVSLDRQFLHAYQLRFHHPITGILLELEAPLPDDLQSVLGHETVL